MNSSSTRRRGPVVALMLLVTVCGLALALQGWRSRIPTIDLVPHYLDAIALVREGDIPTRGTISGYLAYNPPGPTWLMVPGVIATDDPRLVEFFVSPLLYVATLLGIYKLARLSFGRPTALLAAVLYGFSEVGLFVAGSLWPRAPIQPFIVWMVYWLQRWAVNRQAAALPIALAIWGTGLFVFMEIAPAVALVAICWLVYRPPIRPPQLVLAAAGLLLLWWPYLAYEASNDYRDLRSMLLRAEVGGPAAANRGQQWCDPLLTIVNDDGGVVRPSSHVLHEAAVAADPPGGLAAAAFAGLQRVRGAVENSVQGVIGRTEPADRVVALVIFLISVTSLVGVMIGSTGVGAVVKPVRRSRVLVVIGVVLMGAAVAVPALLISRFSADGTVEPETVNALRALQALMLVSGALFACLRPLSRLASRLAVLLRAEAENSATRGFLVLALLVPWVLLMGVVEPGRSDRFWWLWPMNGIFLAAFVFHVVGTRSFLRQGVALASGILIVGLCCVTPSTVARIQSWATDGWAGDDADAIQAVEFVAARVAPRREAGVGYHLHFFRGIPGLSAVDRRFKVGTELDLVLRYRYGIANVSRCPEGLSPDDTYRLVDDPQPSPPGTYRVVSSPDPSFRMLRQFGRIGVFERAATIAR